MLMFTLAITGEKEAIGQCWNQLTLPVVQLDLHVNDRYDWLNFLWAIGQFPLLCIFDARCSASFLSCSARFVQFSFPYAGGYNCTCRWQLPPFQPFPLALCCCMETCYCAAAWTVVDCTAWTERTGGRWRMEAPFIFQPQLQENTTSVWCPAGWHKLWGILVTKWHQHFINISTSTCYPT